jgi:predicted RNase H-like nuclease (RuvC/YqgF family)
MTTTDSKTVKNLKSTINTQSAQIAGLMDRISALSDDVYTLKTDLTRFKKDVAGDVEYLTQRVDGDR